MSRKPRFPPPAPKPEEVLFAEEDALVAMDVAEQRLSERMRVELERIPALPVAVEGPAELCLATAVKRLVEIAESPAAEVAHRVEALEVLAEIPAMRGLVLTNLQVILSANVFGQTHLSHVRAARTVLRLLTKSQEEK